MFFTFLMLNKALVLIQIQYSCRREKQGDAEQALMCQGTKQTLVSHYNGFNGLGYLCNYDQL